MRREIRYLKGVTTLELFEDKCSGCGMCAVVCPHGVMAIEGGLARIIDQDGCMECSACSRNCPEGAITVQSGVGCAQAVIHSALGLGRSSSCCDLEVHETANSECKPGDSGCGCEEVPKQRKQSGCC
jgi:NAD-dependent dihydropyrimidine dehydrogenase PreA subunit